MAGFDDLSNQDDTHVQMNEWFLHFKSINNCLRHLHTDTSFQYNSVFILEKLPVKEVGNLSFWNFSKYMVLIIFITSNRPERAANAVIKVECDIPFWNMTE